MTIYHQCIVKSNNYFNNDDITRSKCDLKKDVKCIENVKILKLKYEKNNSLKRQSSANINVSNDRSIKVIKKLLTKYWQY